MARSLKGYVRNGLLISEGLAFYIEDDKTIESDFIRDKLGDVFRKSSPSKWSRKLIFPTKRSEIKGIEYFLELGKDVNLSIVKYENLRKDSRFELRVSDHGKVQSVGDSVGHSQEYLERLFDHVHRYVGSHY